MATFIWLWAYSLKTPISILCAVALAGCFLSFLSARSSGRGDGNLLRTLNIGVVVAIVWGLIYALPEPNYDVKEVVKEVKVPNQTRVITRVITQRYTQDSRFDRCIEGRQETQDNLNFCMDWAKKYMQPRIAVVEKKVPVYSGVQIRTVTDSRDTRVKWCQSLNADLDFCTKWAFKMEAGPQVQVRVVHDSYQQLFDKCNAQGTIPASDPNGTAIRNERIKICGDLAMRASHDH